MKNIAILTSGGDSPGMNAAIRSIVRAGIYNKRRVFGIYRGYDGLIDNEIKELNSSDVSNIIQLGGTILKSARSERFMLPEFRKIAFENLQKNNIGSLIVLGGDGTFKGASVFSGEFKLQIIGIPCTIDNDLYGTDFCIGYDTAINTAMEAIDKIRDTADSHNRLFFVEVMGRDAGLIALRCGIAGGAEGILIPETVTDVDALVETLNKDWKRTKSSMIVVVAEGDEAGGAYEISKKVKEKCPKFDMRVTTLGHIQRGGSPTCMDRVLASRLGLAAVEALINNEQNLMVGIVNQHISKIPFDKATKHHQEINSELLHVLDVLAS